MLHKQGTYPPPSKTTSTNSISNPAANRSSVAKGSGAGVTAKSTAKVVAAGSNAKTPAPPTASKPYATNTAKFSSPSASVQTNPTSFKKTGTLLANPTTSSVSQSSLNAKTTSSTSSSSQLKTTTSSPILKSSLPAIPKSSVSASHTPSSSISSLSSSASLSSSNFTMLEEHNQMLQGTFNRFLQATGNSSQANRSVVEKLCLCLSSNDGQVRMNAIAIAGLSAEANRGVKEIISLLSSQSSETILNGLCQALINTAGSMKSSNASTAQVEFRKLSSATWTSLGNALSSLFKRDDPDLEERMNIIKFFANVLCDPQIVNNFLKSEAINSICSTALGNGKAVGKASKDESRAILVLISNMVSQISPNTSGNSSFSSLYSNNQLFGSLFDFLKRIVESANPDLEQLSLLLRVFSVLSQDSTIRNNHLCNKQNSFIRTLLQLSKMKLAISDVNICLRVSRICGNLMADHESSKHLIQGGIFSFYSQVLQTTPSPQNLSSSSSANDEDPAMIVLAAIGNLALNDQLSDAVPHQMSESHVFKALQDTMTKSSTKPDVKLRCGVAISNLMTVESLQMPFAQTGGIKTLLETTKIYGSMQPQQQQQQLQKQPSNQNFNAEMLQKALSALFHLSLYYDSVRKLMVDQGSLQSLGGIVSNISNPKSSIPSDSASEAKTKVNMAAMKTLYNLSLTEGKESEFVKQGVLKPLLEILSFNPISSTSVAAGEDYQNITASILENLAQNDLFNQHFRDAGGVDMVVKLIQNSESKPKVQERASKLVARLAINSETRKQFQNANLLEKLKKMSATASPAARAALDMATNNLSIPVIEYSSSSQGEETDLLDKFSKEHLKLDADDEASMAELDKILREDQNNLFGISHSSISIPAANNIPSKGPYPNIPIKLPHSPQATSPRSPPGVAKSQPLQRHGLNSSRETNSLSSSPAGSPALPPKNIDKGPPPPLPPKPPPKPAHLKGRRQVRIQSQPNGRSPLIRSSPSVPLQQRVSESTVSNPQKRQESDEQFEDHGIRKESYMIVGDERNASPRSKKKQTVLSSFMSMFRTESEEAVLASQLHTGPWQVNEEAISQKCPSLIYDYWEYWCDSCKRDGSLCDNATEDLRRLRIKLIKEKAPKSFAPKKDSSSSPDTGIENSTPGTIKRERVMSSPDIRAHLKPQIDSPSSDRIPRSTPPQQQPPTPPSVPKIPTNLTLQTHLPNISSFSTTNSVPSSNPINPSSASSQSLEDNPEAVRLAKMHLKRTRIAQELLTTEGTFIHNLGIIIKMFQQPLNASLSTPKPLVSEPDLKVIFGSVEIIYNINLVLIEKLNMKMRRWTSKQTLGEVFIYMADWLKIYSDYINNYDKSQSTLLRCKEENPRFAQFLAARTLEPVCALRGLETFLVTPIQRPPRYSLLLKELIKNTDQTHPDWNDLNRANERIEEITMYLNDKRKEFDSRFRMIELAHSLTNTQTREQIVQPHRENLLSSDSSWTIKPTGKSGSGKVYLLNDSVLITKSVGKTRQKLIRMLMMEHIAISTPSFIAGQVDDPKMKEMLILNVNTQEQVQVMFTTVEQRDQMFNQYRRLVLEPPKSVRGSKTL